MSIHARFGFPAPAVAGRPPVENHYCSRCQRTERFHRSENLRCLGCGKLLYLRRRSA